jgi:hypothetical protein
MDWTLNYVQQAEDLVLRVYEARCTLEEDTAPDHGVALSQPQAEIPGDPPSEILETNNNSDGNSDGSSDEAEIYQRYV